MDQPTVATVIDALPFPVVATDTELSILAVNASGKAMLRSLSDEADIHAGTSLLSVVPDSERPRFEAAVAALGAVDPDAAPFPSVSVELIRETAHGNCACHVMVTPLRPAGGSRAGFVFSCSELGVLPDDSRLREQEAARMEVARQLAATMNHEVNNPLFVVSATLEDLLAEVTDPAEQRRLNAALDAVWRVSSAVKKLSEIRQLVTTPYIDGFPMIDLDASQVHPGEQSP